MQQSNANLIAWIVLLIVFTTPILLLGNRPLLEGLLGVHLPASAVMFVVPTVVTVLEAQRLGVLRKLMCTLRPSRRDLRLISLAAVVPFTATAMDQWLQESSFPNARGPGLVAGSAVAFTIAAAFEELGWNVWLLRGLQGRAGIVSASFIVGGIWALWHVYSWFDIGNPAMWVGGQIAFTMATRWFIGEISVMGNRWFWPALVAHASGNLAWSLSANEGSDFRPHVVAILVATAAFVLLVRRQCYSALA